MFYLVPASRREVALFRSLQLTDVVEGRYVLAATFTVPPFLPRPLPPLQPAQPSENTRTSKRCCKIIQKVAAFFADGNSAAAAHSRRSRNLLLRRRWSRVPVIDVEQIPGSLGVQCGIVVYSQSFRNFGRLVLGLIEADFCNTRSTRLAHLCTAPSSKYKQKCGRLSHIFKMSSDTRESMRMNSLCLTVTVEFGIDFTKCEKISCAFTTATKK